MTKSITRLFDSPAGALRAAEELERTGIPHSDISFIGNNREGWYDNKEGIRHDRLGRKKDVDHDGKDDRAEGAGKGAGTGAVLGGGAGLLAGLGMLAIPGLGPIVAAGWLASTATGAIAGAAAGGAVGGILGALSKEGVPKEDAEVYAEAVRRGGSLLTVRAPDDRIDDIDALLARYGGTEASSRSTAYRSDGWDRFDSGAPEYTEQQIAAERDRHRPASLR
jgi:hypothetical protein